LKFMTVSLIKEWFICISPFSITKLYANSSQVLQTLR
jgi:hypothetical protein